jgi:AcrR family transcriptional regulator
VTDDLIETRGVQPRVAVEARCRHILDAACACVRRDGFHGASMAEIAKAAGLSVGQIYRYFENKEAIIAAIADRDLAEMHEKFAELESHDETLAEAVVTRCAEGLEQKYDRDRAGLMLEVLAEAARNPRVAAIVQAADAEERLLGRRILESAGLTGLGERELAARGEVLSMLFDGMMVRAVNNPDGDKPAIGQILQATIRRLLSSEPLISVEA